PQPSEELVGSNPPVSRAGELRILHVASGDLWAGAEAQACALMSELALMPNTLVAAALMNDGILAGRLRGAGVSVTIFDERRLSAARIFRGLRGLMLIWKPDVVHTHRAKENILGAVAAFTSGRIPSIRTVHGANEQWPRGLVARARHRLLASLDRLCAVHLQRRVI